MEFLTTGAEHQAEIQQALRQSSSIWGDRSSSNSGKPAQKPNGTSSGSPLAKSPTEPGPEDIQ
jgi:hypothetical protein